MSKWLLVFFLAACLVLTACDGASTAGGAQSQCNSSGKSGSCTVTIASVAGGPYGFQIKNRSFRGGDEAAQVTVTASVETGGLTVYLEGPDGTRSAAEVQAGQSVEVSGPAEINGTGDDRYFRVYFEPAGEGESKRAENIKAEIQYQTP